MESYTKISSEEYFEMRRKLLWLEGNNVIRISTLDPFDEIDCYHRYDPEGAAEIISAHRDEIYITQHEGMARLKSRFDALTEKCDGVANKYEKLHREYNTLEKENRELIEAHTMALDIFHSIEKRKEWWKRGWLTISRAEVWIKKFRHLARTGDPT